jgi:hypothetical protein
MIKLPLTTVALLAMTIAGANAGPPPLAASSAAPTPAASSAAAPSSAAAQAPDPVISRFMLLTTDISGVMTDHTVATTTDTVIMPSGDVVTRQRAASTTWIR